MVDLVIIAIYFALIMWIGLKSGNKINGIKEFSVGNRNFSVPVLVAALSGTLIGGGGTFGLAEKVFSSGLIFLVAYCGILVERILTSTLVAEKMQPFFGMITAGDIMGQLYGKNAKVITGIATVTTSIFILGAHITTTGFIFQSFTGIPLNIGLMISTIAVLIYSAYGGIAAVSFTDVVQFCFMLVSIPLVAFLTLSEVGGFAGIVEAVPKSHLNLFELDRASILQHGAVFLSYSLPALYPVVIQRMLMAKNIRQIKVSLYLNTFLSAFYFSIIALIGLLALTKDPNLNAQHAFPFLIQQTMPTGIKGLIIVGLLATVMSTVDSFLNLIGVSFTNDVLQPLTKSQLPEKQQLIIARVTMVFISLAGLISAMYFNGILENVFASMNLWLPFIFPPLFLGIRFNQGSSSAFILGGCAAAFTLLSTKIFGLYQGFLPTILAAMANGLIIYAWPKFARSPKPRTMYRQKIISESLNNLAREIKTQAISYLKISDTMGLFVFLLITIPLLSVASSGKWVGRADTIISIILSCAAVIFILKDLWIERISKQLWISICLIAILILSQISKPLATLCSGNSTIAALTNLIIGAAIISLFFGALSSIALVLVGMLFGLALLPFYSPPASDSLYHLIETSLRILILVYFAVYFRKKDKNLLNNFLNLNGIMAHEVGHSIVSMNFCAKRLRNSLPTLIDCYKLHAHHCPNLPAVSESNIKALQKLVDRLTENANRTKDTIQIIQTGIESNIAINGQIEDFSTRQAIIEAFNSGSLTEDSIKLKISPEDFCITANRGAVIHVFINIFKNSVQALKEIEEPNLEVKIFSDTYTVKIIDNGPGIPSNLLGRIFENGFTTKPDGQGKGLAFCSLIMASLGGSISVESTPGCTAFHLNFHQNRRTPNVSSIQS